MKINLDAMLDAMQTTLSTASVNAADCLTGTIAYRTVPYGTIGITGSFLSTTLFKCPYCGAYSNEPGICKNCGGVKELVR